MDGGGAQALLTDGSTVCIRQAGPDDRGPVRCFYEKISAENLRLRFFSAGRRPGRQAAENLARGTGSGDCTLLALAAGEVVGLAEYHRGTGVVGVSKRAELALAVADTWHNRGVGTLLLEHLVHAARREGVEEFTAEALAENRPVLKVFADLGLHATQHFEGPEVRCTVSLREDEQYLSAIDSRAATAVVASLEPLWRPRSVAVIGAGSKASSVGRSVLRKLRDGGFTGSLHAVNPHAHSIEGITTYPLVSSLPERPELAVIAVPAETVPEVAEECGVIGVRALVVLSAGLDRQNAAELLAACRRHGMRLVGPNCLGVVNTEEAVRLDATFAAQQPHAGTAGLAVQSGGVGIALLSGLSRLGIGISEFASLGDKLDVSGNDLLEWFEHDGRTDLVVLYLESFGNPRFFSRTARRVTRRLPVLTIDAGRSDAGRRAAASHTAAAATRTMTRKALFAQAGVTAVATVSELMDAAALMHSQPLPRGGSVAIVTNAGGMAVLAADACAEAGLTVPELPAELVAELRALLPDGAAATNPIDATARAGESTIRDCLRCLTTHHAVDAFLVPLVPTAPAAMTGDEPLLGLVHASGLGSQTVAVVLPDQAEAVRLLPGEGGGRVPAYNDPLPAARSLAHAVTRADWLARPPGTLPRTPGIDASGAAAMVNTYLAAHPGGGWLDPRACSALLSFYRIPLSPWEWARNGREAVAAAARLASAGRRVALKAHRPGAEHKADEGAVRLDLAGDEQVLQAYSDLRQQFGGVMTGAVVQPMAERGVEVVAGVVQDDVFGPLVLFGFDGTATEVMADHAARLAPLTDTDVHDLIRGLRCSPLLLDRRTAAPVDLAGLEELVGRLSRMACDLPQLAEADLNPVVVSPRGILTLDVRVRLMPHEPADPYLRHLR